MTKGSIEPPAAPEAASLTLGDGWHAQLARCTDGIRLRVARAGQSPGIEISIVLTEAGPVLRASAAAIEVESAGDFVARCNRFRVEAVDGLELISGGTLQAEAKRVHIDATHGGARIRANDNVQLLGENVLLNCEQAAPALPAWALTSLEAPGPSLPLSGVSGDEALLSVLAPEP